MNALAIGALVGVGLVGAMYGLAFGLAKAMSIADRAEREDAERDYGADPRVVALLDPSSHNGRVNPERVRDHA